MKKLLYAIFAKERLLSELSPTVYFIRVWQKRIFRALFMFYNRKKYRLNFLKKSLPYRYTKHSSKLIRNYMPDNLLYKKWQTNKIVNLKIAIKRIKLKKCGKLLVGI